MANTEGTSYRKPLGDGLVLRTAADVEKAVAVTVLGVIPIASEAKASGRRRWGMPAWIEPGLLLVFLVGLVIGAGIGALIVGLL